MESQKSPTSVLFADQCGAPTFRLDCSSRKPWQYGHGRAIQTLLLMAKKIDLLPWNRYPGPRMNTSTGMGLCGNRAKKRLTYHGFCWLGLGSPHWRDNYCPNHPRNFSCAQVPASNCPRAAAVYIKNHHGLLNNFSCSDNTSDNSPGLHYLVSQHHDPSLRLPGQTSRPSGGHPPPGTFALCETTE